MVGAQIALNSLWNSKLVLRIALAMFTVILLANAVFSYMSLQQDRQDRLYDLEELARYSIIPALIEASFDQQSPPITSRSANRLILTTLVSGLSYYNLSFQKVGNDGRPLHENTDIKTLQNSYDAKEGIYTVVFEPEDLGISHYVVAQIQAANLESEISRKIQLEVIIVVLLSSFVTLVLIIALSRWFLDPILYLYNRLTAAARDPENPPEPAPEFHSKTEIGRAIEAADILMTNNANSIKSVKAMAESEVNRLAYYDTLTGLPNRVFFVKTLKETLANTEDHFLDRYAVLAMDIDHFKDINDTMGHSVGDAVLKAVAGRLEETVKDHSMIARSGEDEFAIMLPLNGDVDEAERRANEIIDAFRDHSIIVMDEQFQVRVSIGVAVSPEDADMPEEVLKCADTALNRAKIEGRDRCKRYDGSYTADIQKRFQILRDLREAMNNEDLELFYQPQINIKTGKLEGVEALIRWWKPGDNGVGGGFVSPVDFIPVAEQSGLILPLGDWIMRKACETAKAWADEGLGELSMAVNVSGHQFLQKDIVEKIKNIIDETGINPKQLEIEVTESVFMEDTDHSIKMLKEIQALGVPIAIDDFGTGYSSLSYLQRFPMDKLKIDRAFVSHIDSSHDNLVLTKTIIALCKTMGLKVVAEGVETKAEEGVLIAEDCDVVQGYRYSAPIPDAKFRKFAREYTGKLDHFD